MTNYLAYAQQLANQAAALLADPGTAPVSATLDPRDAASLVDGGDLVVVVNPPEITWETWHEETLTWSVWVIAGPANDLHSAWDRLSNALDLLHRELEADGARPDGFVHQGVTYPAYVLTITSPHSKE